MREWYVVERIKRAERKAVLIGFVYSVVVIGSFLWGNELHEDKAEAASEFAWSYCEEFCGPLEVTNWGYTNEDGLIWNPQPACYCEGREE